jgi:hypothetical protein
VQGTLCVPSFVANDFPALAAITLYLLRGFFRDKIHPFDASLRKILCESLNINIITK